MPLVCLILLLPLFQEGEGGEPSSSADRVPPPWWPHGLSTFGSSVANAGDVDADGVSDLIAGCWLVWDSRDPVPAFACVFSGRTGGLLHRFDAEEGDGFGWCVNGIGEVNGDGHGDFAIAGSRDSTDFVRVYSGKSGGVLYEIRAGEGESFGEALIPVTDLDGDGATDLALGGRRRSEDPGEWRGFVRVVSGADGRVLRELEGVEGRGRFGHSLCLPGDLDGDGTPELAVGVLPGSEEGGATTCEVFSLADGERLVTCVGPAAGTGGGMAVAGAGDLDRDGAPDLWMAGGTYYYSQELWAVSGADGSRLLEPTSRFPGDLEGELSLAGLGDVSGDGVPDLVVGVSPEWPTGAAYVVSGSDGLVLRRTEERHPCGDALATAVVSLGDVNGDGVGDFAAGGAPMHMHPLVEGFVGVYSGADCRAIHRICRTDLGP